jgi:probable HAF family extracellular repeat protein
MKIRRSWSLLVGLLLGATPLLADILYSVTDLGTLGGTTVGSDINNKGQVVGSSNTITPNGSFPHAFLYSNGQMTDLGTLGGRESGAGSINDAGQITGSSALSDSIFTERAFLYSNGQMTDLGTLGGRNSDGRSINNRGQVTGRTETSLTSSGCCFAFLYSNGQMQLLGTTLLGVVDSIGTDINDAGQVTVFIRTLSQHGEGRAFLYSNGQMRDIGTLGGAYASASAINNAGQITGTSGTSAGDYDYHAFLYTDGQMKNLGTLGGAFSYGVDLNNAGQVVGYSSPLSSPHTYHAYLYSDDRMYDLNDLIDPALNITLREATAINDQGQIVANSGNRAFLLTPTATPIPEPSTLALFGVTLLGLGARSLRHPTLFRGTAKQPTT